jgi:hypothetical protein
MNLPNAAAPGPCHDIPRLLQQFEGLGENCDFGVVQRAAGIEPLGLLRFGACTAADMVELLQTLFQTLLDEQDLWLDAVGPEREYWVKSRHCSFTAHTNRFADKDDIDVIRSLYIERSRYLAQKLISHLTKGRRLLVYKGEADITTIQSMVVQLKTYGPNWLLWICVADKEHPPGSVQQISDGLLCGFVSRYGTYELDPSLPVEEWIAICANAYHRWRGAEPRSAPLHNLISTALDQQTCRWLTGLAAVTRVSEEPAPAGGFVLGHRLTIPGWQSVCRARLPIDGGGNFVFSAWLQVPEDFKGRMLGAHLPDGARIGVWTADLKSHAWQRAWMAATAPLEARTIDVEIFADGPVGTAFRSASWCLERGSAPLGYHVGSGVSCQGS